jgi:putative phosphoribosyl transferase
VVCLETPEIMYAIGYHFRDFSPVSDEEVVATLQETRRSRVPTGQSA